MVCLLWQEAKDDFKKKTKDLEHLCKTGTALIDGCKVEESRKFAEQKLSETNNRWGDLLKSLDDKTQSLLAKQKEVEHYMNLLNQFSRWMNSVEIKLEEPIDLFGNPHKIADKLDEMKVICYIMHSIILCHLLHHIASYIASISINRWHYCNTVQNFIRRNFYRNLHTHIPG